MRNHEKAEESIKNKLHDRLPERYLELEIIIFSLADPIPDDTDFDDHNMEYRWFVAWCSLSVGLWYVAYELLMSVTKTPVKHINILKTV